MAASYICQRASLGCGSEPSSRLLSAAWLPPTFASEPALAVGASQARDFCRQHGCLLHLPASQPWLWERAKLATFVGSMAASYIRQRASLGCGSEPSSRLLSAAWLPPTFASEPALAVGASQARDFCRQHGCLLHLPASQPWLWERAKLATFVGSMAASYIRQRASLGCGSEPSSRLLSAAWLPPTFASEPALAVGASQAPDFGRQHGCLLHLPASQPWLWERAKLATFVGSMAASYICQRASLGCGSEPSSRLLSAAWLPPTFASEPALAVGASQARDFCRQHGCLLHLPASQPWLWERARLPTLVGSMAASYICQRASLGCGSEPSSRLLSAAWLPPTFASEPALSVGASQARDFCR